MKISIIITAYNCEKYIEKCIKSCLNQDYKNFEILLYDDASTDKTKEIANRFEVDVYSSSHNMGALYGRQMLVNQFVEGDVVCFLGGDDELLPGCLFKLAEAYQDHKVLMTYGSWINEKGNKFEAKEYPDEVFENKSFRRSAWKATALNTFRTDLLKAIPEYLLVDDNENFFENCTDLAYSFPALEMCKKENVKVIKESIYLYNQFHSNTTLNRLGTNNKTYNRTLLKIKPIIHKYYEQLQNERILEQ